MRVFAFILISLSAGVASTVVSAQVTASPAAQRLTEGETLHNRLLNPFTDVTFNTRKVLPGGSVLVTARGNFPAGTTIISERDGVAISGAALSATTYSARLTIPSDEPPGFVRLWAFDPIGIEGPTAVALVDTLYRIASFSRARAATR